MKAAIVCVIDRSGSMASIAKEAIGGFNAFLEAQKNVPGEATLTYVQFDNKYEMVHDGVPLEQVPALDSKTFVPRGMTALLDAVGRTIDDVGRRLAAQPEGERPDKVIVCILTDGQENASSDYSKGRVREMIEHQRSKYGWEFIFLGANQDAFAEGSALGIQRQDIQAFDATAEGTQSAYSSMSARTTELRVAPPAHKR